MDRMLLILPPHKSDYNTYTKPAWAIVRVPPISLLAVGSYIHANGYEVRIIDCRELIMTHQTNDYMQYITEAIDDFKPDVIGINILTALFPEAVKIAREIKHYSPDSLIIAGGVHPSVEPELTFKQNPYIDAICIGAGEEVSLDIMEGKELNSIPGLMLRNHIGEYVKREMNMDIDKYPFPNYDLVNESYYTVYRVNAV